MRIISKSKCIQQVGYHLFVIRKTANAEKWITDKLCSVLSTEGSIIKEMAQRQAEKLHANVDTLARFYDVTLLGRKQDGMRNSSHWTDKWLGVTRQWGWITCAMMIWTTDPVFRSPLYQPLCHDRPLLRLQILNWQQKSNFQDYFEAFELSFCTKMGIFDQIRDKSCFII